MIQVETSVISDNCLAWKERLNSYRAKLAECQSILQEAARKQLTREELLQVEQLHNQLHVQQVNIHDLKHAIRSHFKKTDHEFQRREGHLKDDTMAEHTELLNRYRALEERLRELQSRFVNTVNRFN